MAGLMYVSGVLCSRIYGRKSCSDLLMTHDPVRRWVKACASSSIERLRSHHIAWLTLILCQTVTT